MSSFDRTAWDNLKAGGRDKNKEEAIDAVVAYLEQKLTRHSSKLPSRDKVLVLYNSGGWKYGGSFHDSGGRLGYRIVISSIARVIHVHLEDTLISQAHFIHKLAEVAGKTEAKLDAMDGQKISTKQAAAKGGNKSAYERNLQKNLPQLAEELRKLRPKPGDRQEAIIYNSRADEAKGRYPYTNGSSALELLKAIRQVINTGANAQVITGAVGILNL